MRLMLLVHILGGALGLGSGYVALAVTKGATLHRKAGILFVCAMLVMSISGMLISAIQGVAPAINVPSALLTFYLVITSLTTVRSTPFASRRLDVATMAMALAIGVGCFALAVIAIANGGREAGVAYPLFLFGGVALMASAADRRILRGEPLRGGPRLARHLWRMCFAMFIASIAFYLGPDRVPEPFRNPAVRAAGVLVPIAAMSYWLWRLRVRGTGRIVHVSVPDAV